MNQGFGSQRGNAIINHKRYKLKGRQTSQHNTTEIT